MCAYLYACVLFVPTCMLVSACSAHVIRAHRNEQMCTLLRPQTLTGLPPVPMKRAGEDACSAHVSWRVVVKQWQAVAKRDGICEAYEPVYEPGQAARGYQGTAGPPL